MLAMRKKIIVNSISSKTCVYCGVASSYLGRPGGNFCIICGNCRARGPVCDSATSALEAWEEGLE